MKRNTRKNKGITLVALVITVIILLILAGISIATLTGSGLFEKARIAEQKSKDGQELEDSTLSQYENIMNSYLSGTSKDEENNKPTVEIQDTHTITTLTYSWEELEQIANIISDNDDTITNETLEVQVTIGEKVYTVGVGDLAIVTCNGTDKTVRLMGFNHDTLTNSAAYGEGKNNTYAGISFEFVNFITTAQMNSSQTNSGGWASSVLRGTLNNTIINILSNKEQIKEVQKSYIATYNSASSVGTSNDKLWLLSCSEIWNNGKSTGYYGYALTKEGEQYKYYKDINATYDTANTSLIKDSNYWWLRSPYYSLKSHFCRVDGGESSYFTATGSYGVVPGFAI